MKKFYSISILILSVALGAFFVYKGINKHFLSPCKVYGPEDTVPLEYQNVITAFCNSGFNKFVGLFEVLAGLLLIIPRTRLIGALVLLPIISNIFMLHFKLDNRPHELVETGIPLAINLLIIIYYYPTWKKLLVK